MRLVRRETELRQGRSGGDALVAMVQASDLRNGDDLTSSWALMLIPMVDVLILLWTALTSLFRSRVRLEAEILVLRQQINVLRRKSGRDLFSGPSTD